MALYLPPVPPWNAAPSEKIAYLVVIAVIIVCFGRIAPHSRSATVREIVAFLVLTVVLVAVTLMFPFCWHVLGVAWER